MTVYKMMVPCTSTKLRLKKWFIILPRAIEHSYSGSMTQNMESAHPVWSSFVPMQALRASLWSSLVPRLSFPSQESLGTRLAYGPAQSQSKSFALLF